MGAAAREGSGSQFGEMNLEDLDGDAGKGEMPEATLSDAPNQGGLVPPICDH